MIRFGFTWSVVLACGVLVGSAAGSAAAPATPQGGFKGSMLSVSCAAPGECAAGGYHTYNKGFDYQAFVVSEKNGKWGRAIEVPGLPKLNPGGYTDDEVESVSCAARGECAAGGVDWESSRGSRPFVVSEKNGVWGHAIEVPGIAKLNLRAGGVVSVSCPAVGECVAGGAYTGDKGRGHAFVVSETNGVWGEAIEVPGTSALATGDKAGVNSVSCTAAGECAATGYFDGLRGDSHPFVVSETNGVWGDAIEVPGMATLNSGGWAEVDSLSCAAPGECAAGGTYKLDGRWRAFVVGETSGSWGDAVEVSGTATPDRGFAGVASVACPAPGECTAGGYYRDLHGRRQAFVVDEMNGSWDSALEVPGSAKLNTAGWAEVRSVSCTAPGECATGGQYVDDGRGAQVFVASETHGSWGKAIEVPGTAALGGGGVLAGVDSVSCTGAGNCTAGGSYTGSHGGERAFFARETNGRWSSAAGLRSVRGLCVVPNVVGKTLRAAKKSLNASHCGLGPITTAYSKVEKGRVVVQETGPGKILNRGTRVALTISQGRKTQVSEQAR
jgi:hypothetical protein